MSEQGKTESSRHLIKEEGKRNISRCNEQGKKEEYINAKMNDHGTK